MTVKGEGWQLGELGRELEARAGGGRGRGEISDGKKMRGKKKTC